MLEITDNGSMQLSISIVEGLSRRVSDLSPVFRSRIKPFILQELDKKSIPVRTGRLRRSYFGGVDNISEITKRHLRHGTRVPYAVYIEARIPIVRGIARDSRVHSRISKDLANYILGDVNNAR